MAFWLLHTEQTLDLFNTPHLDVSPWVDFVDSIAWCSSCLSIQVVALNEDGMITQTSHPHITLTTTLQLNTFTYV